MSSLDRTRPAARLLVFEQTLSDIREFLDGDLADPHYRIINQTKRVGCGYRDLANYERRILSHIAVTRPQRSAA
jgi:hypothetical protein